MPSVTPLGFFRELEHGLSDGPLLRDAVRAAPGPDEGRVVAYLKAGALFCATPGTVDDVLSPGRTIGPPHVLTDGRFAWPADLAHYVETYHVALPPEFTAHAARQGWRVPGVDVSTLSLG